MNAPTRMFLEAAQGPTVVAAQLAQNAAQLAGLGARLRAHPPRAVVTCARGSSTARSRCRARTGRLPVRSSAW